MPSKKKDLTQGVSSQTAAIIHALLADCLETSLRAQLLSGEFNANLISKALDFIKHNNITVSEDADAHLKNLKAAFVDSDFSFLNDASAREI